VARSATEASAMNDDFPPLPDSPAARQALDAMKQAVSDVRTGNPEAAVLRRQVERLERERDELAIALGRCHRAAGRGEGHGGPEETATCIVSAIAGLHIDASELSQENDRLQKRVEELELEVTKWRPHNTGDD
jgi:hypothetical protein